MKLLSGKQAVLLAAQSLNSIVYTDLEATSSLELNSRNEPTNLLYSEDALVKLVSSITRDKFSTAAVSSHSLISSIPNLYSLASSNKGTVIHVSAGEKGFSDFTRVMSVGQCGLSFLTSSSVQEAYDFALISHVMALRTGTSFLHFFDSRRVSDEFSTIQLLSDESLLNFEQKASIRNPESPEDVSSALSEVMNEFGVISGRRYLPWTYSGHPQAECVIVAMGAGATVVEDTVSDLLSHQPNDKVGILKISLYRPWSSQSLWNILPRSIQRMVILEPIDDCTTSWNPLFLDIVALYQDYDIDLFSGQYGVNDLDFSPNMVQAIFDLANSGSLDQHFKVSQLPLISDHLKCVPDSVEQSVFVASESLAMSYASDKQGAQVYTVNGSPSVSYVRLNVDRAYPFLIDKASAVVIPSFVNQSQIQSVKEAINALVKGGSVVFGFREFQEILSGSIKRLLYIKQAKIIFVEGLVDIFSRGKTLFQILLDYEGGSSVPNDWNAASIDDSGDTQVDKFTPEKSVADESLEVPYLKMLDQVFGERLEIANAIHADSIWSPNRSHPNAATPEFGYGRLIDGIQKRSRLVDSVIDIIQNDSLPFEVIKVLSQWLLLANSPKSQVNKLNASGKQVIQVLEALVNTSYGSIVQPLLANQDSFISKSSWLVGSDAWSVDLGLSGIHHVITSGENINLLVIDTTSYLVPEKEQEHRKKDIGLFAMNYGSVYVASVALYSSYTGVLHALLEADAYSGPSIVIAYLPQKGSVSDPLEALKETKICVDNGKWPLYRWNPNLEEDKMFTLDSQCVKRELEDFLKRENHLSLLSQAQPNLKLVSSLESEMKQRHLAMKQKARLDYSRLLSGLSNSGGPPLTVLFGSDNGNAEGIAKKVSTRAKSRGLKVKLMAMDDYGDIEDLANEVNLVVVCSTAGQGEMPSNAREFWKALNSLNGSDGIFSDLSVSVLGLGDSHYWPREEDTIFYNRPGKVLDAKFESLGATRLTSLGLCDDQDEDGFETGYNAWLPGLWKSLGVRGDGDVEEPVYTDNQMKIDSNFLRGNIAKELVDDSTGGVTETTQKLMKFHGCYVQDDRDIREERKKQGLEKAFSFLIRIRTPGGVSTPQQWLMFDELSEIYGNKTMKLTTRQAYQLHGVLKKDLRTTIRSINKALLTTLATCGDVNRNIMSTAVTDIPKVHEQVQSIVTELRDLLAPKTNAYHEIWLEDKLVSGHAVQDQEPIYSPAYLPRKFKIVIAVPPSNDVDAYAHDLGFVAIVDKEQEKVTGYNVLIGGGMGQTHGNKKTYPRPASLIGYIPAESVVIVSKAVVEVQRDYGDRINRKHARFKYTIDDLGLDFVKKEIEIRSGVVFEEARPFTFESNVDRYGWSRGIGSTWNFGMFIENGRVKDTPDFLCKTGLRELAKFHKGEFRLTANQHLLIANVPEEDLEKTKAHLAKYKLDNLAFSGLRKTSMACVALPTCSLAMAESERYLPKLVTILEDTMEEAGLADDSIVFRMTGCPNGCSRPYLAEVALVGKAPNTYNLYLGGSPLGNRLNKIYRENLQEEAILNELKPLIKAYALERNQNEPFGDWVIRAGYVKRTITGKDFHEV